ncbi:MAG: 2,3-bisphosphoglycerate-dependent phosphoglycerate mutase [Bacteroidota bacterium]|jgi:2,3-bisphosphoglycerate-dependent phosphoglycerate mutase|nr:2,3-diphosphoglycerate-dependent phosphoglycerate mutase [Bacteroidota bacterium]
MPTLVLVRHGQSQWNLENRFTGWVDVPLSAQGEEEAARAGGMLATYHFDLAFTSALQRAQNTLRIMLRVMGNEELPIIANEALNERMYGMLQGLNKAETAERYGDEQVLIWRRSYDVAPPDGESLKDTAARVIPYVNQEIFPLLRAGKNVLVAAHGNSLRALVMQLEGMSPAEILQFEIPTAVPRVYTLTEDLVVQDARFLSHEG